MRLLLSTLVLLLGLGAWDARAQASREVIVYERWLAEHATVLDPLPGKYEVWWDELDLQCRCAGPLRPEYFNFYIVPGGDFLFPGGRMATAGIWMGAIVLSEKQRWNKRLVQHEMLHSMLSLVGESRHPKIFGQLNLLRHR